MEYLQEHKCPCCGGAIQYDSSLQKVKCPYCDTDVGRILRTFKIKKNVEVTDNGKIII